MRSAWPSAIAGYLLEQGGLNKPRVSRVCLIAREGNAPMQIGVAGLGRMGAAIAQRLMEVGHTVTVWNRAAAKAKPLADVGAKVAASPAELARTVDIVITILTDAAAIDAVYHGPSGLLSADVKGKLFIEMSTVRPETEIALAERVRAKGAAFVECPVGGSTGPARQGKLIGLMGAEPADAARAKPILEQLCRRLEHCGPVRSGSTPRGSWICWRTPRAVRTCSRCAEPASRKCSRVATAGR